MEIIEDFPPNIDEIRQFFPLKGTEIFAYGNIIYNPSGGHITSELIAHECVHQEQQGENVEEWWKKYLTDSSFRYIMELEAHQIEYQVFCDSEKDRNVRAKYLMAVASRLASPLYGRIVSLKEARKQISARN
tara:strand:+ start:1037 stop:1432 length:396 start_codon:yes stop_codon:yes gene_type:complete